MRNELTPEMKDKFFSLLNKKSLPWQDCEFVLNGYDDCVPLGEGSFSEVYELRDKQNHDKHYAVKIIGFNANYRVHKNDIKQIQQERVIPSHLAQICDYVVKMYDSKVVSVEFDESGNVTDATVDESGFDKEMGLVLVMFRMDRLSPVIEQGFKTKKLTIDALKKCDLNEVLNFSVHIAEALNAAHKEDVMHRDVKLENIFYDEESHAYKLGDFGIARLTDNGSASTKGAGSNGYMAPEVDGGGSGKGYTKKADIYSFGIVLYLLLNNLKYPGSDDNYYFNREFQYNPKFVCPEPEHGTNELKKLVCSMVSYSPEDRPASMGEVLEKLKAVRSEYLGTSKKKEHAPVQQEPLKKEHTPVQQQPLKIEYAQVQQEPLRREHVPEKKETVDKEIETQLKDFIKKQVEDTEKETAPVKTEPVEKKAEPVKAEPVEKKAEPVKAEPQKKPTGTYVAKPTKKVKTSKIERKTEREMRLAEQKYTVSYIVWGLIVVICLLYFGLLTPESMRLLDKPVLFVVLAGDCVVALVTAIVDYFTDILSVDAPLYIHLALGVANVIVLFIMGYNWIILATALFILPMYEFGVIASFAVVLVFNIPACEVFVTLGNSFVNERFAWIFFALAICGALVHYSYENKRFKAFLDDESEEVNLILALFIGLILLIAGIVIFILNKFSPVQVPSLVMHMHFIYVGLILLVAGCVGAVKLA